jgi:peroxiredoxin
MPVPAVYLINEKGKVKFAYYNVDYTKRLSNEKILQAIEEN